ncbi:unnamed protein product [Cuscuta epithymum]|uniref:Cationic amino acid transporter 1-like n=1 Tax=Cuscuta epithymum TaxID=186058 RepID=A0AAV0E3I8_9ASTE|nr:unnamed protein product [Cuscuta epithymum]
MGFVFFLGNTPISWCSTKQDVVALSTCEAEYIAACYAACQGLWLLHLFEELNLKITTSVQLYVDNKSAIDLARNPVFHGRSKHIETRFHFLRSQVKKGTIVLSHCSANLQIADGMTKALKTADFRKFRDILQLISI